MSADNLSGGLYDRTARLLGIGAVKRLSASSVAVFGIGGVGGHTAEALARSGVGRLLLVDADTVDKTNLNRQIIALRSTVGKSKAAAMRERILDINPDCRVSIIERFYPFELSLDGFDYVADCIDTVSSKLELISRCSAASVPVISCMGTGNKLDASAFRVADISETSVCPLARVMRYELKKRGITGVKCVFSPEKPLEPLSGDPRTPASVPFVPGVAGLIMAGEIIKALCGDRIRSS